MYETLLFLRYTHVQKTFNISSVQFSHSVMSDALQPHGPQHSSPPCPSPTPRVFTGSKPTFSLSSLTFIKKLFSSSSLSAISVVLSAYLRLVIFLSAILILACASSSPAFLMMYSTYKLNKQVTIYSLMHPFSYLEPVCCSMSSSKCCFLTCVQISQEVDQMVWYSHLFKNFPQFIVIHKVKGFGIVNKAEIDVFLELSCFFSDPADVGCLNLWFFCLF